MHISRKLLLALPLFALIGIAAQAADAAPATGGSSAAMAVGNMHGHAACGGMHALLHQLNLSGGQKTQIRSIHAQGKPQFESLRASSRANRNALATTAPTDPAYAPLLATAKEDAGSAIQLKSNLWAQVYAVLTPAQRAQIPALMAAAQQKRAARRAAWEDEHEIGPL